MAEPLVLRTAAWYGDRELTLRWPAHWHVAVHRPVRATPLGDDDVAARLRAPLGQPPLAELARGRKRPLVIVDDLNRPTPAWRVLPAILAQLADAGIPAERVRIVMGPGTHGAPAADAFEKKIGREAAHVCQLLVHDCRGPVVSAGRTSAGTPILVNPHVVDSDLVIGVGGVYPNQTAGFGGGAKLALGVLGFRSIASLHHRHASFGWGGVDGKSGFRRDLEEIAERIGLETTVGLLLDGERAIVDLCCGETREAHAALVARRERFRAPRPAADTHVVIANAYPNDLSLTFVRMKGLVPLAHAPAGASRVAVASCPEGLGFHGLFPFLNAPRHHRERMLLLRLPMLAHRPGELVAKVLRRVARELRTRVGGRRPAPARPVWVYRPSLDRPMGALPADIPGMRVRGGWDDVVRSVDAEQGHRAALQAEVYACTPLQWIG